MWQCVTLETKFCKELHKNLVWRHRYSHYLHEHRNCKYNLITAKLFELFQTICTPKERQFCSSTDVISILEKVGRLIIRFELLQLSKTPSNIHLSCPLTELEVPLFVPNRKIWNSIFFANWTLADETPLYVFLPIVYLYSTLYQFHFSYNLIQHWIILFI